jgi:hypothetical protein
MENGLVMLQHSAMMTVVLYLVMVHVLNQSRKVAGNRALLIGASALIYMILFGHGLPSGMPKF